ncbi:MAG: radical SAM protein [Planctomycetes bacterium]|jgi:MoaA/NifB/PqqE/SkfB family radical SAM enzyme|nr:radical SAM protein [Planctomycetota bacterium]
MILPQLAWRFLRHVDPRCLATFAGRFGLGGLRAIYAFQRRRRRGAVFPSFLFISLTSRCNLCCQGCWVVGAEPPADLSIADLDRLIAAGKAHGSRFFGLLGGEPTLHPHLYDILARHRDCYFQLFSNGLLLDRPAARRLKRLGNVSPVISIEGDPSVSDTRRGGWDVHARSFAGVEACVAEGLMTGVAGSLCKSNLDELLTEHYLDSLIDRGVLYAWYYIYRPSGPEPHPELALSYEEIRRTRRFIVEQRCRKPIMIVDSYWDHRGRALCPAAVGVSHHVNPAGYVEPCPPIQFAAENIRDDDIGRLVVDSGFLAGFRELAATTTRGCILMDDPAALADFVTRTIATDTSGRSVGTAELLAMQPHPSHHQPGDEIAEKHWAYRFAKKHWFFGFGAYG